MTLEEILQKHFGLEGDLCLDEPEYSGEDREVYTPNGYRAYEKMIKFLYDLNKLIDFNVSEMVDDLDHIEWEV